MDYNPFIVKNLKRQLVQRSTAPRYKGNFALTTDVNLLRQFPDFCKVMESAARSMPDAHYIHFKTETDVPADAVRYVPTILQSFNRTRTMRRAQVSGLRMCNLFTDRGDWYYVTDMVVSCSFDALALACSLSEYAHVGSFITATYPIPQRFKANKVNQFANMVIERFWSKSRLARHAVAVYIDDHRCTRDTLRVVYEPKTLQPISLLTYILNGYRDFSSVEVGRNSRLIISKKPMYSKEDYLVYQPDKRLNDFRYRHFSGFGIYYNNPDFPIY